MYLLKLILDTNEHVDWVGSERRERPFLFLAPVTAMHHLMILKRLSVSLFCCCTKISMIVFTETKRVMTHMI